METKVNVFKEVLVAINEIKRGGFTPEPATVR